ncbi:MAG: hypothetical protein ACI396_03930 [Acutalibacteraceae bacterium]
MKSAKAAKCCEQAAAAVYAVDEVWQCIRYQSLTICDIVKHLCGVKRLEILGLCAPDDCGEIDKMIDIAVRQSGINDEKTADMLYEFLCSLGKSDLSGQQSVCELYRKKAAEHYGELKERLNSTRRLYSALGVLGSLFCAVLMI